MKNINIMRKLEYGVILTKIADQYPHRRQIVRNIEETLNKYEGNKLIEPTIRNLDDDNVLFLDTILINTSWIKSNINSAQRKSFYDYIKEYGEIYGKLSEKIEEIKEQTKNPLLKYIKFLIEAYKYGSKTQKIKKQALDTLMKQYD